jgi:sulfite reductase (NADPH) flavoprotein alpha-component
MLALLPETAPFSADQRAWLNGFFAGLLGLQPTSTQPTVAQPTDAAGATRAPEEDEGDFAWHDPALTLEERMPLAVGKPIKLKLMAAMGQLDCGQCGYLCKTYAEAISTGAEQDFNKCVPGGKATAKMLKKLRAEEPANIDKSNGESLQSAGVSSHNHLETAADNGLLQSTPTRDRPAKIRLRRCDALNAEGADKDTRAIALALGNSGLTYEVGDSLGVWPTNNPEEVELLLSILRAKGSKEVTLDGQTLTARDALTAKVNLREPTAELFALMAEHATLDFEAQRLTHLAADDSRAAEYGIHDVFDTLVKFRSARPPVAQVVRTLARLQPRLYSIASSPHAHPGEVHLTVGVVRYDLNGRRYQGLGSGFFAEHLREGRPVPAFVQKAHGFRLPSDPNTPVIMVGPGTGIAPFRAFLEERAHTKAAGKNWLFFGAQHSATDFLYRDELHGFVESGVLTRLSLAFSRDQAEKIYVQHRMHEEAAALWQWLTEGACFYVCGDAKRMAADVDHALIEVAATQGGMSLDDAKAWVKSLAQQGRYLRDVY